MQLKRMCVVKFLSEKKRLSFFFSVYFKVCFFSDTNIGIPAFFLFLFAWNILFHSFTFSVCGFLLLLFVCFLSELFCGQHFDRPFSFIFFNLQPSYVFWLVHLAHLHLNELLIGICLFLLFIVLGCFCSSLLFSSSLGFFCKDLPDFFSVLFDVFLHFHLGFLINIHFKHKI